MSLRHRTAALMMGLMGEASGVDPEVALYVPKADCARCRHRKPDVPGSHCYMFSEKPGERCGQFSVETSEELRRRSAVDKVAATIREERLRRKRENFLKRQPRSHEST